MASSTQEEAEELRLKADISCSENTSLGVACLHFITELLVKKKRRGLTITVLVMASSLFYQRFTFAFYGCVLWVALTRGEKGQW